MLAATTAEIQFTHVEAEEGCGMEKPRETLSLNLSAPVSSSVDDVGKLGLHVGHRQLQPDLVYFWPYLQTKHGLPPGSCKAHDIPKQ